MFVGEIGLSRHEFLYEIAFWEARRILRGYKKRYRLTHQLLAEVTYAATFSMRSAEGKKVEDFFPSLFKDDDYDYEPPITEEQERDLQELMAAENARLAAERQKAEG